jgi:predicted AlkP superfamily pyrophosphatase or phosphodiesterase
MLVKATSGFVFLLLGCMHLFGIYIFLKGFLLSRHAFDKRGKHYTAWERFPIFEPDSAPFRNTTSPYIGFNKAIVIVVDALRFDFLTNSSNEAHYLNKVPLIQHLYQTQPESSLLFQFRADPPTTTMQRVKGLMTGSLPTFIDAGSNFASSAVTEDQLLYHIRQKFQELYLFGDDTWVNLFPDAFDPQRTFESDSFKMLDLDSVDDRIESHLWPLLASDKEWHVLIAHFLGVDHCGHTHGPSHPNMARKLSQMNGILTRILEYVDQDTLLVVMGDHGMSVEGDHGGESVEELMSSLFLHSKRPLTLSHSNTKDASYFNELYQRIHQTRASILGYDVASISSRLDFDASAYPIVSQIHLVPTLAYLLQVPIPFGNLGAVIPDVLYSANSDRHSQLWHMIEQFRKNALQVHDYLLEYSQQTHQADFSMDKLEPILHHLYTAERILIDTKGAIDQHQLEMAILEYDAFLITAIKYCEAIWAQFDTGCMCIGILLLCASTLALVRLVQRNVSIPTSKALIIACVCCLLTTLCVMSRYTWLSVFIQSYGWFEKMDLIDWAVACVTLSMCTVIFTMKGSFPIFEANAVDWIVIVLSATIISCTLGSNSFVIWEDKGSHFILMTLCLVWWMRTPNSWSPVIFSVLIRFINVTGVCREEQQSACQYVQNGALAFEWSTTGFLTCLFIALTFFIALFHAFRLENKTGKSWLFTIYLTSCMIVIARMVQDIVQNTQQDTPFQIWLNVYLPRLVYGMSAFGLAKLSLQWIQGKSDTISTIKPSLLLWSAVLALLQRPLGGTVVLLAPYLIHLLAQGQNNTLLIRLTMLHFLGLDLFFATGHQATFTSLPWKAAFIGFDEMNYYGGMILVTFSTIAGPFISWIGWFIIQADTMDKQPRYLLPLLQSIPTFLSAIFIFILRRHLMTWKIFAPRFLFQVLLHIGSYVAVLLLSLVDIRAPQNEKKKHR